MIVGYYWSEKRCIGPVCPWLKAGLFQRKAGAQFSLQVLKYGGEKGRGDASAAGAALRRPLCGAVRYGMHLSTVPE